MFTPKQPDLVPDQNQLRKAAGFGVNAAGSAVVGNVVGVEHEPICFGPFCLSPGERLLTREGEPVEIGGRSFDLLVALTEQPGRVLSKRELLKRVWSDVVVEDGSLRFHMAGLRKLLGDGREGARYIATQVGVGYAFVAAVERIGSEGAVGPGASARAEQTSANSGSNLPRRAARLIGREHDVELLADRLAATPLFTIVGPAGVGKTSLAVEIGHRLCERFDSQVTFVDFSMIENPALVGPMIAGAMGIAVQTDDPIAVVLGYIRDKRTLLLLDNCEHLIEPIAAIAERILDHLPDARILATSREPLRIAGEHVHRLEALAFPEDIAGSGREELLAYPAVQLFCERALAADTSLVLDDATVRLVAEMCRRLDGMALPIELAAVQVATHGISATAQQLGERFSLGWAGRRTAQPRQQTLQATLDWSYELLSEVERLVFERLAMFVGPFSIDGALELATQTDIGTDQVAVALDQLISKSLISSDRSQLTGTYRMLEMTRAYAREKLRDRGGDAYNAIARRHASFFLSELEGVAGRSEDLLRDVRALRLQLGNIRIALDWAFSEQGDRKMAIRLAAASAPVFLALSQLIECRNWCVRAIDVIEEPLRGTAVELELQAALGLALMFTQGNSEAAGAALSRALELATLLDDHWNQLRILGRLHIFHERIGEYGVAAAHAACAVGIAEAIGAPEALGVAYSLSGISYHLSGDQVRARRDLEVSLRHSPPSQRSRTIHYGFDHRNRSGIALARTLWLSGLDQDADRIARQTVAEAARLEHPVTKCIALIWSLSVHLWMGELDVVAEELGVFSECARANMLGPYIAAAAGFQAELAIDRGRSDGAIEALEESIKRLKAARYDLLTTAFSMALARGLSLDGRLQEALEIIDATIARCEGNGERFALPELFRMKAGALRRLGEPESTARATLETGLRLAREQGAHAWERRIVAALAEHL